MKRKDLRIQAAACAIVILRRRISNRKRIRKIWAKKFLQNREKYSTLIPDLRIEDAATYKNFFRMSADDFDYLLQKVSPLIQKQQTLMRKPISAKTRLAITLRYLATGDSYHSLMYLFRVAVPTISNIIPEVVKAIFEVLNVEYLKMPTTSNEWKRIAQDFQEKWNFPNCIGALDGKHVNIRGPHNGGSDWFNYKNAHSIILLALVDANYKFIYVNIGAKGRNSDGGVYSECSLASALENKKFAIPESAPLPGRHMKVPYCIVADDAFPLKINIMKPFPFRNLGLLERIFNYRLSRARRIVENVFGIASARFRVLRRTIELHPEKVKLIAAAVCVLHNFLMTRSGQTYAPKGTFDFENDDGTFTCGSWRSEIDVPLRALQKVPLRSNNAAKDIRDEFKEYFSKEGEVSWQNKFV